MIIDELIVVLGLDSRKFTEGQRDAVTAFKKGKDSAIDFGKSVQEQGEHISGALGMARKGVLGLIGAFAGGEAAAFIGHVVTMDAATGRMAKTIGTSVANLSTWQYMVRQVGGSAESATAALSALQQEVENVRQGGGMFDGGFASLMNQSGASIRDDADVMLRKIQKFLAGQISSGKMRPEEAATYLRRVPGMNQDVLNVMLADFDKLEAAAKEAGTATKETADAAQELTSRFSLMTQALERFAAKMIPVIDLLMKPMNQITGADVKKAFPGSEDLFIRGSLMDRLDRAIWGDHNMADAKEKLAAGLRAQAAGSVGGGAPGGGTRGDRNNNPGNMEYGAFARAHGATGQDGRFAVFPDWQTGAAAQQSLVSGKAYAGLTLHEFAKKYAEGAPAWERTVGGALGIGPGDIVNNQDPRLLDAIRRAEGTGAGRSAASRSSSGGRVSTSTSTNEVHIGKIDVHAPNATDADGIAGEIGDAMKRQSLIAPINYGLTG